jgi:hypothetical protein
MRKSCADDFEGFLKTLRVSFSRPQVTELVTLPLTAIVSGELSRSIHNPFGLQNSRKNIE